MESYTVVWNMYTDRPRHDRVLTSMATCPTFSFACGAYDATSAIRDGRVRPSGFDLVHLTLSPEEIFWRQLRHEDFDISEMSLSAYVMERSKDVDRFVGLPVFPLRAFRHSSLYVNSRSDITEPGDLRGRRVGIPEYHMTAALWVRGLLSDEYGVSPEDIFWVQGGLESAGREERVTLDLPAGVNLTAVHDRPLAGMLETREIDALLSPTAPTTYYLPEQPVKRLFPDAQRAEAEYMERTGIFPIMHLLVLRREIFERAPWVAGEIVKLFAHAQDMYEEGLRFTSPPLTYLPFAQHDAENLLFSDPHRHFAPRGVEPNVKTLETALRYSFEQGLSDRHVTIEDLFPSNVLDTFSR